MKGNIKSFVADAFDYRNQLRACSIDRSVNIYLLEHIANGLSKYKGVEGFRNNADKWLRSICKIYKEIRFDYETNQIQAVIDLEDQLVVIDNRLYEDLKYIIDIIDKYGLTVTYNRKGSAEKTTTTLCRFFEDIEGIYPVIKERYKGLGSSEGPVSKEIIMDPKTRRLIKVTMDDLNTFNQLDILVGSSKQNLNARKDVVLGFKFDKTMIDN